MGIATELIERGWIQGDYMDEAGRSVCLIGAAACDAQAQITPYAGAGRFRWDVDTYFLRHDPRMRALAKTIAESDWDEGDEEIYAEDAVDIISAFNDAATYEQVLRVAKEADELLGL